MLVSVKLFLSWESERLSIGRQFSLSHALDVTLNRQKKRMLGVMIESKKAYNKEGEELRNITRGITTKYQSMLYKSCY